MSFNDLPFSIRCLANLFFCIFLMWVGYDPTKIADDAGKCLICHKVWTYSEDNIICKNCNWEVNEYSYLHENECPICHRKGKWEGNYLNCYFCDWELPDVGWDDSYQLVAIFALMSFIFCFQKEISRGHW